MEVSPGQSRSDRPAASEGKGLLLFRILAPIAIAAVFLVLSYPNVYSGLYGYDEADYMYASSFGFWAQATDTPTLSLLEFLKAGTAKGPNQRSALSEKIRDSNDMVFYRHWHGPLLTYWLSVMRGLHLDEHATRATMLVFPILTLLALYLGALWLFPEWQGMVAAILCGALILWSYPVTRSSELAPHQIFLLEYVCSLVLLTKTVQTGKRKFWYLAVFATAFGFCTLEIDFIIVLTLIIVAYRERLALRPDLAFAGKSASVFLATVLIVWPAALFKLSFLKAYAFMAYLAVFRSSQWGREGFLDSWQTRFKFSAVEWVLVALAIVLYCARRDLPGRRLLYPWFVFSTLMFVAVARVITATPRYVLPYLPALDMLVGLIIAGALAQLELRFQTKQVPMLRAGALAVICAAMVWNTGYNHHLRGHEPDVRGPAVLSLIREHHLEEQSLLVPSGDLPTIHYYLPGTRLRGYTEDTPGPSDLEGPRPAAILYPGYPVHLEILR